MPSLRALEVMVTLARVGSIGATARALHLSQPAVSHQVASLEREVGVPLVDRNPAGATLTRYGRALVDHARLAVDAAERAVGAARTADAEEPIRLAVAESFTLPFLVPVVTRWNADGRTPLQLVETTSAAVSIDDLRAGLLDLVVVPGPATVDGLHVERLGIEEIVVVGRTTGDVPAGRLPVAELGAAGGLIGVDASNGYGAWLAEQLAGAGVLVSFALQTRSVQQAAALASAGFGVAPVPRSALGNGMVAVGLHPPLERSVLAITRASPDESVTALVEALRSRISSATRA
ncbi:LysR family transcriptional regulator [Rathayibacter sp. VKM Ac-2856]|uniref:LysR family transcriptional regulator n=1 Tax=unclassified Rathayibacter TaxID=2609250 RepID=UPI001563429D|nr:MULTISPECIES: LysR family transcriptional regulator [unclassified Rathayibacter]NQX03312.1 LysR family transcriptional regulator [Rathayibacter sp. VKM Ac-2858]NQX18480.1 LysR family transcriptional regulator [Rathayibacter sp. VKM Ac-2856]